MQGSDLESGSSKSTDGRTRKTMNYVFFVDARGENGVQIVRYTWVLGENRIEPSGSLFLSGSLKMNSFIR